MPCGQHSLTSQPLSLFLADKGDYTSTEFYNVYTVIVCTYLPAHGSEQMIGRVEEGRIGNGGEHALRQFLNLKIHSSKEAVTVHVRDQQVSQPALQIPVPIKPASTLACTGLQCH